MYNCLFSHVRNLYILILLMQQGAPPISVVQDKIFRKH